MQLYIPNGFFIQTSSTSHYVSISRSVSWSFTSSLVILYMCNHLISHMWSQPGKWNLLHHYLIWCHRWFCVIARIEPRNSLPNLLVVNLVHLVRRSHVHIIMASLVSWWESLPLFVVRKAVLAFSEFQQIIWIFYHSPSSAIISYFGNHENWWQVAGWY